MAGGNKQREYISKEDVSSPTVATEAILLLCIIDAKEERDVTVINIPNVFIQMRVEHKRTIWQSSRFMESLWISSFRLLPMSTSLCHD